jgi:hypothetical protein
VDATRFDRFSRALASRMNRRRAVQALGGGTIAAATTGAVTHQSVSRAQDDAGACKLDLTASVRVGTSTDSTLGGDGPGELTGQLSFSLRSAGELTDAVLALSDGTRLDAVGQTDGRALTLRVEIPLGGTLVLVGAGSDCIPSCEGVVDGLFTGPSAGDLGDWHGTFSGSAGAAASESTLAVTGSGTVTPTPSPSAETARTPAPAPSGALVPCAGLAAPCQQSGPLCCEGLVCAGGQCLLPTGAECVDGVYCEGGACLGGSCTSCLREGEQGCDLIPCCPGDLECIIDQCVYFECRAALGMQGHRCGTQCCYLLDICDPVEGCRPCKQAGEACLSSAECCEGGFCVGDVGEPKKCMLLAG